MHRSTAMQLRTAISQTHMSWDQTQVLVSVVRPHTGWPSILHALAILQSLCGGTLAESLCCSDYCAKCVGSPEWALPVYCPVQEGKRGGI